MWLIPCVENKDIVSSSASTTLDKKENLPNVINIPTTSSNVESLEKKSSNLTKEMSENIDMTDVEVHENKEKDDKTGSREGLSDSPALDRRPLRKGLTAAIHKVLADNFFHQNVNGIVTSEKLAKI